MLPESSFYEIAVILGMAAVLGIAGRKLRQPLIIMFLATGIVVGPACLGVVKSYEQIDLLAHMGIAILLFIVGLKLDLHLIRSTGPVALATGLGQIVFTSLLGFVLALAFRMPVLSAAYVAVALTFSSTIIIVKLLSDKGEIDSLHGQIALGFLIVQDIAAIVALVGLTSFGSQLSDGRGLIGTSLVLAAKGFMLLGAVGMLMKYAIPPLVRRLAHSTELLILFAIAWAVFLAAASDMLGFSKEVGAFLAGISLASTEYRDSIGSRLSTLRDFLLLFFFIDLGARLDWSTVGPQVGPAAVFSIFVLVGNPLIVLAIMGVMGYRRRTSLLAGLTVAQISEFSLIVAALGLSLGHITKETMGLITVVGVVTIFASTYMILYSGALYRLLSGPLRLFERSNPYREAAIDDLQSQSSIDAILVGLGNYGSALCEYLVRRGKNVVGVDFDPGALEKWRGRGISVIYDDIGDPDAQEKLPLAQARWVISTVPAIDLNLALLQNLHRCRFAGKVATVAGNQSDADELEKAGAHLVLRPFSDAAEQAADALASSMDFLPQEVDWPIAFLEVRIPSDAYMAGHALKDITLRSTTGASILSVSRGGRMHYDPGADFQIYPGDRLLVMGMPTELRDAKAMLCRIDSGELRSGEAQFEIGEIDISPDSPLAGRTLAELRFRQNYDITVAGIQRGAEQITKISPTTFVKGGDVLIVIGKAESVQSLKAEAPL